MPNRPSRRVFISWRDEWGNAGDTARMTRQGADYYARDFGRPGCWAAVVDVHKCVVLREYGTRFAALVAERNAAPQGVWICRKPAAREGAADLSGRISAAR